MPEIKYGDNITSRDKVPAPEPPKISRRSFLRAAIGAGVTLLLKGEPNGNHNPGKLTPPKETPPTHIDSDELPDTVGDLITREKLLELYHVRIHDLPPSQYPQNYVVLDFRESAKESKLFKKLKEDRLHLDVFVVDSFHMSDTVLSEQQRTEVPEFILQSFQADIQSLREDNKKELEKIKPQKVSEYQQKKQKLDQVRITQILSDDKYNVEVQALEYIYGPFLREVFTQDDLLLGYQILGITKTNIGETSANGTVIPHAYVFIAARNVEPTITFTAGSESKTVQNNIVTYSHSSVQNLAPSPKESLPSETSITLNPPTSDYAIKDGYTAGVVLRHEDQHARGVVGERDADMAAVDEITKAHQRYIQTGDTSGYYITFRTPEGTTLTYNISPEEKV